MEVQSGQLVHDDAHGDVLALPGVHAGHKAIQYQCVQCPDDAFHLRVVGNQQVTGVLRVGHFQVEVIAVLVEYPVALLGRQTGGIDTQRADHAFQLFHRLVLESRLERAEQRSHLVVGL